MLRNGLAAMVLVAAAGATGCLVKETIHRLYLSPSGAVAPGGGEKGGMIWARGESRSYEPDEPPGRQPGRDRRPRAARRRRTGPQNHDGPVFECDPGDIIHVPPGTRHIHGALPGHDATHIAITRGDHIWDNDPAYPHPEPG